MYEEYIDTDLLIEEIVLSRTEMLDKINEISNISIDILNVILICIGLIIGLFVLYFFFRVVFNDWKYTRCKRIIFYWI